MFSKLRVGLRRVPVLHQPLHNARLRVHDLNLRLLEHLISRSEKYEILVVFGMRRAGNHLAINWILNQVDGCVAFYNNINFTQSPYSARMTEMRLRLRNPSPRIILSYEDVGPQQILSDPLLGYLKDRTDRHRVKVRFALILRDPYNLFASRIRKWPETLANSKVITAQSQLYVEHARLAMAPRPIWRNAPLIPILYNDLVSDPSTRSRIAAQLGIREGDRGLDHIPVYGHGSSFDGTNLSSDALRDNVFSRWQGLQDDPTFRAAISNTDLQAAGKKLFGIDPPDQG